MRTQENLEMGRDRVPTGIEGFDSLIEGGIPRGSLVLLARNAGSGKKIFSAQYLYCGCDQISKQVEERFLRRCRVHALRRAIRVGQAQV